MSGEAHSHQKRRKKPRFRFVRREDFLGACLGGPLRFGTVRVATVRPLY